MLDFNTSKVTDRCIKVPDDWSERTSVWVERLAVTNHINSASAMYHHELTCGWVVVDNLLDRGIHFLAQLIGGDSFLDCHLKPQPLSNHSIGPLHSGHAHRKKLWNNHIGSDEVRIRFNPVNQRVTQVIIVRDNRDAVVYLIAQVYNELALVGAKAYEVTIEAKELARQYVLD